MDSGRFDWAASGKFPGLTKPNPSYHGVVLTEAAGSLAYIVKIRVTLLRDTGAALSPFHSFLFLQGLETLSLRVERHVSNALKVVKYLSGTRRLNVSTTRPESHPDYRLYRKYFKNGAGSIFTLKSRGRTGQRFIDKLKLFSLLANVADVKSLVIHPPALPTPSSTRGAA